jgi:hypothetical protein
MESDEAVWALYVRALVQGFQEATRPRRDGSPVQDIQIQYYAQYVHDWNTYVPKDPAEAAIFLEKRREATLLLSKGEDVSHLDEWHCRMR